MRKTLFTLFTVLSAMLFVSCEKEFTNTPAGEPTGNEATGTTGKMIIRASIADMQTRTTSGTNQTRTTVQYGNTDYSAGEISEWVKNDQIRVYFYDTDGTEQGNVVFKATDGGPTTDFVIDPDEPNTPPASDTYTIKAIYPKDAADGSIGLVLNGQTQGGTDLSHLGDYDLMTAQASSVQIDAADLAIDLSFTHRLPLLRFSLQNDTGGNIEILEINVRSENSANSFHHTCHYDMDSDDVVVTIHTPDLSLIVNNPVIADQGTFDAYMIASNEVYNNTDNLIVSITFNDGANNGIEEFTISRAGNAFLQTPFEGGKRYYFKLKLTEANTEYGTDGDLRYRFNVSQKTATILGIADEFPSLTIPAKVSHNSVLYDVVAIENEAFFRSTFADITFASGPGSKLETIGNSAFGECSFTNGNIVIPASVTTIREGAFYGSTLTTLTFETGSQLETIGDFAFAYCHSLAGPLVIPANVTTIGEEAFVSTYLTTLTFEPGSQLETIGDSAFFDCSFLTGTLAIPEYVTSIGNWAFFFTAFTGLTFESGSQLETIGDFAFRDCTDLSGTIEVPASVTTIGKEAFRDVTLTEVTFEPGSQLETIGSFAFFGTPLTTINMHCTTPPALGTNMLLGISGLTINVPSAAAALYNTEINSSTKGWLHSTGAVTLNTDDFVMLSDFRGATGTVTISATL